VVFLEAGYKNNKLIECNSVERYVAQEDLLTECVWEHDNCSGSPEIPIPSWNSKVYSLFMRLD